MIGLFCFCWQRQGKEDESESDITPDMKDSECDKSEGHEHITLLLGDKACAAAHTGKASAADLRSTRERFGRCVGICCEKVVETDRFNHIRKSLGRLGKIRFGLLD